MAQTLAIFLKNEKECAEVPAIHKKSASLHSFLDKPQSPPLKRLSIISVHGSKSFDKQISIHAPEEKEFIRITYDLQNFHNKPHFDLIFFSPSGDKPDGTKLYEQLSYCRMLLKPGGSICFLIEENHDHTLLKKFVWKKRVEAKLLIRAGFTRLHRKTMGRETVFLCGTRPKKVAFASR